MAVCAEPLGSTWRRMLIDSSLDVGTFCSAAPSRVNSVRRHDACAHLQTRQGVRTRHEAEHADSRHRRAWWIPQNAVSIVPWFGPNRAPLTRTCNAADAPILGLLNSECFQQPCPGVLRTFITCCEASFNPNPRPKSTEGAHVVVDVPLVAELLVGGRVDQHLVARGRRAVRDDLGAQVHVALVERGQR